ncbi:MAG: DUF364 domain-containing protein [Pseudomonadales bacterium]|nr:DUF364 domain-containing protein [Pseudomonadales bacterium]
MSQDWRQPDHPVYASLIAEAKSRAQNKKIDFVCIGTTWILIQVEGGTGVAMNLSPASRTVEWSGTLQGRPCMEIIEWVYSWNHLQSGIGLACINALLNGPENPLCQNANPNLVPGGAGSGGKRLNGAEGLTGQGNLSVFDYFSPQLSGARIVVIGRYPGLQVSLSGLDYVVLERESTVDDLPDTAAEYLIPKADWLFLTATALINKSLPRLIEIASRSSNLTTVLMGPSMPWSGLWRNLGIDYLAGVGITDPAALKHTILQGGGMRIFEGGVHYRLNRLKP